jgi:hypothetical protein
MTSRKIASHFAELLDFLPDVLAWVKDRQGRYLWVNRAFLIQYSLDHPTGNEFVSVEDILGKTDYDLSPAFLADQRGMCISSSDTNPICSRTARSRRYSSTPSAGPRSGSRRRGPWSKSRECAVSAYSPHRA